MAARPTEPPRAFKGALETKIPAAINRIAFDLYKMAKKPFTGSELMNLFLPSVFRRPMTIAFKETRGQGVVQKLFIDLHGFKPPDEDMGIFRVVSGRLHITWSHFQLPADGWFPRYTQGGDDQFPIHAFVEDFDPEIAEKFLDVVGRMIRISAEWGLVMRVFNELNKPGFCATPAQMRYVWPSVLLLLKRIDDPMAKQMVKELDVVSARAGDKARIPPAIVQLVRPAYDAVTKAIMLFDHEEERDITDLTMTTGSAQYALHNPRFEAHQFQFDGLT